MLNRGLFLAFSIFLLGCGAQPDQPDAGQNVEPSPSVLSTAIPQTPAGTVTGGPPAKWRPPGASELFSTLTEAMAQHDSVRLESSTLKQSTYSIIDIEYGDGDDMLGSFARRDLKLARVDGDSFAGSSGIWIGVQSDESEFESGYAGELENMLKIDPPQDLKALEERSRRLSFAGKEKKSGELLAKYTFELKLGEELTTWAPDMFNLWVPAKIYVNSKNLPRRVEVKFTDALSGRQRNDSSVTEFSKWGIPVEVDASSPATLADSPAR